LLSLVFLDVFLFFASTFGPEWPILSWRSCQQGESVVEVFVAVVVVAAAMVAQELRGAKWSWACIHTYIFK
jgi:hypothetical protein